MLARYNKFMINTNVRGFILEVVMERCKIVKTNIRFPF